MTRATIQVQIPRPCSAAWEAMTPTAQGRHCAACQLTVTDFTQRTDAEVLALLRQAAGGRVCGRFRAEQLNRELVHAPAAAPRWRAWLLAAATLWGLPAAGQALRNTHPGGPVPGEGGNVIPTEQRVLSGLRVDTTPSARTAAAVATATEAPATEHITGVVLDAETQEPIPGVTILLKGSSVGVSSDADGRFSLDVPAGTWVLQIQSVGYKPREVHRPKKGKPLRVKLKSDTIVLGRIATQGSYSPGRWWKWLPLNSASST
jgi:CarboxypepD_reg-like domain